MNETHGTNILAVSRNTVLIPATARGICWKPSNRRMPIIAANTFLLTVALLSLLVLNSCSKADPLTADELMHESLGMSIDLETLSGYDSLYLLGFRVPRKARIVEDTNEKDWYDGSCNWEAKSEKGEVIHNIGLMFKKGLGASYSLTVSLDPPNPEQANSGEKNEKLPITSRGLCLGESKEKMLQLYGKPTEQTSDGHVTYFTYVVQEYALTLAAENDSNRITMLSVVQTVDSRVAEIPTS